MNIIKKCQLPLGVLLASSALTLLLGAGSGESFFLCLLVVIPSALITLWKLAASLKKDWRSVESWLMSVFLVAVVLFLGFMAIADIASFPFTK